MFSNAVIRWMAMFSACCGGLAADTSRHVSFAREIQPILSNKCYFCHGPDEGRREAGLRLDTFDGATARFKDSEGSALMPGDAGASGMLRRMRSTDPDVMMPPPHSHLTMLPEEIALIESWIQQGGKYEPHWAFTSLPEKVEVPAAGDGWARNEIDRFVAQSHARNNLKPAAEAPAWKLRRRLAFDLTGLPPETDRELSHDGQVSALLSSPHYGEAMAVQWLDAARYADSHGYQSDQLSPQWPWRDWVIRAFNENMPYDRFVTLQLAGDLLPDATRDDQLATAFNRLHRMTMEGGSIHEEYRIEGVDDRVATFGTAFLALTLECSRCHDHKYDPVTARDYYSISAFFNSIPERGMYGHQNITPGPSLLLPTPEQETRLAALLSEREAAWQAYQSHASTPADGELAILPDEVAAFDFKDRDKDGKTANGVAGGIETTAQWKGLTATDEGAVRFDGDRGVSIPKLLEPDWPQPWTVVVHVKVPKTPDGPLILWQRSFGTDAGFNGYECLIENGRLHARVVRDWPGSAAAITTDAVLKEGAWHRVAVTWDGSGKAAGLRVTVDGKTTSSVIEADSLRQSVLVRSHGAGHFTLGQRFRERGLRDGEIQSLRVFQRDLTPNELAIMHSPASVTADATSRTALWKSAHDETARALKEKWITAGQELVACESGIHSVAVMRESAEARPAWLLPRGTYDAPRLPENLVGRATFSRILPPFPKTYPQNRLGLAQWLTQPDHPLTARVFVNRVWQHFFGTGLVATSDNFGLQGTPPAHPELLDWLARDFVAHGWDIKRLCRQIVSSATYRQDSAVPLRQRADDPENLQLARGPSQRLAAEAIRDLALAGSGMLVRKAGGPPVSPYQPGPDLWRESNSMSPAYRQSTGEDLLRRSVYSVWKRTAPLPNAVLFDAAGRETCAVKRTSTNTPLQALVLLNDTQFVEPARALAARILAENPSAPDARLAAGFRSLAHRDPEPRELQLMLAALDEQRGFFKDKPGETRAFLGNGEFQHDAKLDPAELAATTVVCQLIFNSDSVIWKR